MCPLVKDGRRLGDEELLEDARNRFRATLMPPLFENLVERLPAGRLRETFRLVLSSLWFALALYLVLFAGFALLAWVLGSSLPAVLVFLAYLGGALYFSRFGLSQSFLATVVLVVFALILWGLAIHDFQPTLIFIVTIAFVGLFSAYLHHRSFQRLAEQSVSLQKLREELSGQDAAAGRLDRRDQDAQISLARSREAELDEARKQSQGLVVALHGMASAESLERLFSAAAEALRVALDARGVQVYLARPGAPMMELHHAMRDAAEKAEPPKGLPVDPGSLHGRCLQGGRPFYFEELHQDPELRGLASRSPLPALFILPLRSGEHVFGLLNVSASARDRFDGADNRNGNLVSTLVGKLMLPLLKRS